MEPNNVLRASTSLYVKLRELSDVRSESGVQSECTIYRVHHLLRNVNPKAYEPEVIAIGPYHHDKDHLKMMEEQKLRFLQQVIDDSNDPDIVVMLVKALGKLEAKARSCYADKPKTLTSDEFIQMLVLDGCFIVQLVRKSAQSQLNDPIFKMDWMSIGLRRDLMLFENQLPFFVLCEICDLIEVRCPPSYSTFCDLLLVFFYGFIPGKWNGKWNQQMPIVDPRRQLKHLLDFIYRSWVPQPNASSSGSCGERFIDNAISLEEANVKFRESTAMTLFEIRFKEGVIMMAPLTIDDGTDSFLRNLIVYEQYFQHNAVTDYVVFLDRIIDSSKDVELLLRRGIIKNCLGDENNVAEIVNKLCDGVSLSSRNFVYKTQFEDVNKYCERSWNKWMAKLRHKYFNSPWAVISVLVALVLLLLTVTQTLFGILQVV